MYVLTYLNLVLTMYMHTQEVSVRISINVLGHVRTIYAYILCVDAHTHVYTHVDMDMKIY